MGGDVLSDRALNRATLERQLLLRRTDRTPESVVEHLVGLQAQVPHDPYLGLWSRVDGFRPDDVSALLLDRRLVRIVVMRGTIHLVTAADVRVLRPLVQRVLDQELARHSEYAAALEGVDLDPVLAAARELLAEPRTGPQLRGLLGERFPGVDAAALAYVCRCKLPLVQVPPRGLWGRGAQVTNATLEAWTGRPVAPTPSVDDVVLRYFAAFGPATTADVATWSRLTGLREVVDRLTPRLRTFHDERGRALLDLPDAPRPDPDTPAPPRFLPEYDNVLLSHADRTRFVGEDVPRLFSARERAHGTVLVDGMLQAVWRLARADDGAATLTVTHAERLTRRGLGALGAEGRRMVRFLAADATERDVRLVSVT